MNIIANNFKNKTRNEKIRCQNSNKCSFLRNSGGAFSMFSWFKAKLN